MRSNLAPGTSDPPDLAPANPTTAPAAPVSPPVAFLERWAGWIVGIAAVVAAALLLVVGRNSSFFWDEWWFIVRRRDGSLDDLLQPWNDHLIAIPVATYNVMLKVFGLRTYLPYRVLLTAAHVATCLLLFTYLRRRVTVVYALAATVVVLFLGVAWEELLWPFSITYIFSIAGGLGALYLLDRHDRRADVGASVALGVSLLSAGLGVIFMCALFVELAWTRRDRRRLWVVLVPAAGYALWYLAYGTREGSLRNFEYFEPFTTTLVGEAGRALLGASLGVAQLLVVAFYALAMVQAVRTWPVTGRFVNTLALPVAFWALVTYSRGPLPVGTRYAHPGAIFLVLAGAEVLRTFTPPRRLPRGAVVAGSIGLGIVVVYSLAVNVRALDDGAAVLRQFARSDRTRFSALVHVADRAERSALAFPTLDAMRVGRTVDALVSLEYPVYGPRELLRQREHARRTADGTIWEALGGGDTTPRELAPAAALPVEPRIGTVAADGPCATMAPAPGGGAARARVARARVMGDEVRLRVTAGDAPVDVTARSIARGFGPIATWSIPPAVTVAPGATRDFAVDATRIRPWRVRVTSDATFAVCALR